jgi:hypothetical protein
MAVCAGKAHSSGMHLVAEKEGLFLLTVKHIGEYPPTKGQSHDRPYKEWQGSTCTFEAFVFAIRTVFVFLHSLCLTAG